MRALYDEFRDAAAASMMSPMPQIGTTSFHANDPEPPAGFRGELPGLERGRFRLIPTR